MSLTIALADSDVKNNLLAETRHLLIAQLHNEQTIEASNIDTRGHVSVLTETRPLGAGQHTPLFVFRILFYIHFDLT